MINQQSFGPYGQGDCGVVALAVAINAPYGAAFKFVKWAGKYNAKWTGATSYHDLELAAWRFAYKLKYIFLAPPAEPHRDWEVGTKTVKQWVNSRADRATRYIIKIPQHVLAVIDGKVADNGTRELRSVETYRFAESQILCVYEVVEDPPFGKNIRPGPATDLLDKKCWYGK